MLFRSIGPNGTWKERPGTLIATITRERNPKPLNAVQKGEVCAIHSELEGTYVQAGTPLATIRHFLSKDEVLRILLKQALNLFVAPERAKYYFVPQIISRRISARWESRPVCSWSMAKIS